VPPEGRHHRLRLAGRQAAPERRARRLGEPGLPGLDARGSVKGTTTTIGGRPAKRNVQRPGECSAIGADETVAVAIQGPGAANWTQFTGCLRGPDLATGEHEIDSLLASTTFR
jgi:hypothetical protein